MEETVEKPGLFGRLATIFHREDELAHDPDHTHVRIPRLEPSTVYHVVVRRQVVTFDDAVAAADGLKAGEQTILNLSTCPVDVREKIIHYMNGVSYYAEGTWLELGDNVFMLAPSFASVEMAPASQRIVSSRN